ncbi:MAG: DUF4153 domain-containing protein [Planctomycetota bacterium]|jgi:hypothetical protein
MKDLTLRVSIVALYTVAADLLLFDHALGVGVSIFAALLGVMAALSYGQSLLHGRAWVALWIVLAAFQTIDPTTTGVILLVVLGWALLAMSRIGQGATLLDGLERGVSGGLRGYGAAASDLRRAILIGRTRRLRAATPLWVVVVPLLVTGMFAVLLLPANAVLSRWLARGLDSAMVWILDFRFSRVVFWLGIAGGVYGLLRFRLGRRMRAREVAVPAEAERQRHELVACLLTFALINALFLAANIADSIYLWGSTRLPPDVTFSEYAHSGAYRLIFAVLLAAFTLEFFFRRGTRQAVHRGARGLALLFVAQNLVVLAGAARRLALYTDAYGLTRFRLAAGFWLALVAVGLALVAWRIARHRTSRFLLRANAASTILVLSAWACAGVNAFVADFNVDRHLRDPRKKIDVAYLWSLGAPALPALSRLVRDGQKKSEAREALVSLRQQALEEHRPWAAWSLRRARALRAAGQ